MCVRTRQHGCCVCVPRWLPRLVREGTRARELNACVRARTCSRAPSRREAEAHYRATQQGGRAGGSDCVPRAWN
eukprot:655612-Pleurochrysis_carterae.AAC.1